MEKSHSEGRETDGKITLEISSEYGRWMKVAQDSVQWYFVVSGVREVL
jgi:hypothetical protein